MKKIILIIVSIVCSISLFAINNADLRNAGLGVPKVSNHGFSNNVIEKKNVVVIEKNEEANNSTTISKKASKIQKKKTEVTSKTVVKVKNIEEKVQKKSLKKSAGVSKKISNSNEFFENYMKIVCIIALVLVLASLIGLGVYYWVILGWLY
ncbi:MAG: hypothetical protein MJ198_08795 [Bacteroidales bacterium]|nr:hypothetical protein [Bacteroidales bacterium]